MGPEPKAIRAVSEKVLAVGLDTETVERCSVLGMVWATSCLARTLLESDIHNKKMKLIS
jgi:hypothetical protein